MAGNHPHTCPASERAGIVLFSQWSDFCRLRHQVLEHGDAESVHDLRVASRRMRATIGLLMPFIDGKDGLRISKRLRKVTQELGRLRNLDEAMLYFSGGPATLNVLTGMLHEAREREARVVAERVAALPLKKMDRRLRDAVAGLSGRGADDRSLATHLTEMSRRRFQSVADLLRTASGSTDSDALHALRIAVKKLRYLLETFGQLLLRDCSDLLGLLKEYQTVLGKLNDLAEFGTLCGTLKLPAGEHQAAAAMLEGDRTRLLAEFAKTAAHRPLNLSLPAEEANP